MKRLSVKTFLWSAFAFAVLPPASAPGASPAEKNREANLAFEEGNYEEALRLYTDALIDAPESPRLHYNMGVANYGMEKYDEAIEEFRSVLTSGEGDLIERAYYNTGNCLYRQGALAKIQGNVDETVARYEDAIESYVEALKIDPDDVDAKKNIELIRREIKEMMERQEQPQNQQQQQQQEEQQQQQEEQQQNGEREGEEQQQRQQAQDGATPTPQSQAQQEADRPTPSYMTPEEAEQFLENFAQEQEQEMRERRNDGRRRAGVEADW